MSVYRPQVIFYLKVSNTQILKLAKTCNKKRPVTLFAGLSLLLNDLPLPPAPLFLKILAIPPVTQIFSVPIKHTRQCHHDKNVCKKWETSVKGKQAGPISCLYVNKICSDKPLTYKFALNRKQFLLVLGLAC